MSTPTIEEQRQQWIELHQAHCRAAREQLVNHVSDAANRTELSLMLGLTEQSEDGTIQASSPFPADPFGIRPIVA